MVGKITADDQKRLSLEECRKLIGPGRKISDEELIAWRDCCYDLADVVLTAYHDSRKASLPSGGSK